jgi:HSP20 family molecular chaperone IbpA
MTKLTNYNSNPTTYRTTTSLIDAFFNRDPFEHPFFWGDVSRTGDTVRFKEGDELTVEVDLPGVSKDKTTVSVEGRVVSIEGVRKVIHKGGSQEETFSRSFTVANSYNLDKAKAEQKDGVLTLVFPKNKVENGGKKIIDIS